MSHGRHKYLETEEVFYPATCEEIYETPCKEEDCENCRLIYEGATEGVILDLEHKYEKKGYKVSDIMQQNFDPDRKVCTFWVEMVRC